MKKLYLVDVSSMFFRAFFALPHLTNEKGMPTNALYGFLSMSVKLLRDIHPEYIAFCFDSKEPSFRHEMYADYKANREEMPEDLVPQIPYISKLSEVLGVPIVQRAGFEADDLIGTLTKVGRAHGLEVVIVSGDKDFAQLVDGHVTMYDTMKDVRYDREGVQAKWGVKPEQMIDYLSLVGDSSDNVPGVKGIGPKGAQKLLLEYNNLENIFENLDKISGKAMKANLEAGKESAFLSKKLVTIHCDIELERQPEDLKLKPIDQDQLRELLLELGFKTFARTLTGEVRTDTAGDKTREKPQAVETPPAQVTASSARPRPTRKSANGPIEEKNGTISDFDRLIEPYQEVWGLLDERGFYLGSGQNVFLIQDEPKKIGEWLAKKQVTWRGFDLKQVWHHVSAQEPQVAWDSMLAAYVLRAGNIESMGEVYAHYMNRPLPDLMTPKELYQTQLDLSLELEAKLQEQGGEKVYQEIELPLVPVLFAMEKRGIAIDVEELKRQSLSLHSDIERLQQNIFELAGGPFNVASPKQLAQVLFEKLKLPPGKKTKTGFSTDSDVLQKLVEEHPIARFLIDFRELSKLKSTYVDALPALVNRETGRLHTHFNQASTTTGRLSSQNPNLQNIPIRTERGRLVRKAFMAGPDKFLIAADYSQIELRVLAHITEDEALCRAFANDVDIHAATASEIYGVKIEEVTADLRRHAKAVNFGIAYGQGAFGLSESLNISRQEATDIIDRYFKKFRRVREYMDSTIKTAHSQGYVETVFGRRRYIDELKSKSAAVRKFGERAAINAPIQGTASDLVKLAMIRLHGDLSIPMLLQVHDELLFEASEAEVSREMPHIRKGMEGIAAFKVPLKVNIAKGKNWEDAHA